jgi:hypothetical protein
MALTVKFFSFLFLADCQATSSDSKLSEKKENAQMTGSMSFCFLFLVRKRKTPRLFWSDSQKKKAHMTLTVDFFFPQRRNTRRLFWLPPCSKQIEGKVSLSLSLLAAESGKVK